MLPFEAIFGAIHDLTYEVKLKLRTLLDEELKAPATCNNNVDKSAKDIIGLFADEPELIDRVLESVNERRSRPLRLDD